MKTLLKVLFALSLIIAGMASIAGLRDTILTYQRNHVQGS